MKEIVSNAMNAFAIEAESLAATREVIDEAEFARAVEALAKAEEMLASI